MQERTKAVDYLKDKEGLRQGLGAKSDGKQSAMLPVASGCEHKHSGKPPGIAEA